MEYPLYDQLLKQVKERGQKAIDIQRVCDTISDIARTDPSGYGDHYYEIGALILHHETISNGGVIMAINSYDSKPMVGGKGLLHYMTNFPPLLQQIIAEYIETYAKKSTNVSPGSTVSLTLNKVQ